MDKPKTAFDWKGEPSVWLKDKQLKQIAAGQILGKNARERAALTEKKEFFIYSRAKLNNDS
jgi:hypothetical protein